MSEQNPNIKNQNKDLSKSTSSFFEKFQIKGGRFEKRLFVVMILIAVGLVPLTIWQFNSNLEDSFYASSNSNTEDLNLNDELTTTTSIPVLENLRELDTDGDGLNDYDELYNYKTSPYIQDSDSDSIADKIEVDQGTDPNCPEGTTCSREEFAVAEETINNSEASSTVNQEDMSNLSVDQLRQIMIDAGAPEDQVYQISEEDLRTTYQEILQEEGLNTDTSNTNQTNNDILGLNTNTAISDENIYSNLDYETLLNLSPTEIRVLLVQGGVPEDQLSEIDDNTLQEIYKESLYQNLNELSQ